MEIFAKPDKLRKEPSSPSMGEECEVRVTPIRAATPIMGAEPAPYCDTGACPAA